MSHIVIDARELRTSTGRYIERLLNYLQHLEIADRYTVLLKPQDMDGWKPTNPRFVKVASPYKEFTFGEQLGFLRQLIGLRADLVHFGMSQQPVLYRGRSITTVHDLTTIRFTNPDKNKAIYKTKQQVYKQVIKRAASKSKLIITPSEFVKHDLVQFTGMNPHNVHVTYESADPIQSPATALPDLQNHKYIMYVGRPTPHKNLDRLLTAFQLLQAQHPALRLVLAGKKDANYQRIADVAEQQSIKHVVFTDFVTEGELRWLYEHCEAYVFPSLSEGFGLPGLEAMCHGAPVVSSDATCLPEIYGEAAHYFDPLDTQAMADAINEVLTNTTLRKQLILRGSQQVSHYSWRRMAEETKQLYATALEEVS